MSGLPSAAARERTAEVLRHVGLYEERYRPIGGYSTGMKQRVKLAQALVHDPRLLLLDEPTNGLDPAGRDEMLELVRRTGTEFGIAVIVASHLLGEIERVCDFLVAIDAGRLLRAAPLGVVHRADRRPRGRGRGGRATQLAAALVAPGLQAVADGRTVLLAARRTNARTTSSATPSRSSGCRSCGIEQRRHSLEDLFRDAAPRRVNAQPAPRPRSRRGPAAASTTSATRRYDGPRLGRRERRRSRCSRMRSARASASAAAACQDRAVRARGPGPAAGPDRGRVRGTRGPGRRGRRLRARRSATTPTSASSAILIMLFCAAQAPGAVRPRPALRRPAAVLLAGAEPRRLRPREARRPDGSRCSWSPSSP